MPVIAVDGPAASGKGTIARRLAAHFGYPWLDTGLLYRAVGVRVPDSDPEKAAKIAQEFDAGWLADETLRSGEAGVLASMVSGVPGVREALLAFQKRFAAQRPGAVLDGRDIGTVICPQAEAKLFVTADVEVRAHRRHKELQGQGAIAIYDQVLQELIARDARDSQRAVAPLVPAEDAFVLDTSSLDADAAFARALALISPRIA
ncbi:MAG: (d)CMP kinase [Elsteraceae bacterium]